jgi:hypothetical protein
MRQRPKEFVFLAMVLLLIAVSLPIQVMMLYQNSPFEISDTISKLAPLNWVVMILALVNAALVYSASPWVMLTAPLFIMVVIWNNYLVADAALNFSPVTAVVAIMGTAALHGALLTEKARKILKNPTLRWWRSAPRKQISVRALVTPVMGGELQSMTFDISMGGAFISAASTGWKPSQSAPHQTIEVGSRCAIRLMLDQFRVVTCSAEVVRQTEPRGHYPGGFAVRFVNLDPQQRKILATYLKTVQGHVAVASATM